MERELNFATKTVVKLGNNTLLKLFSKSILLSLNYIGKQMTPREFGLIYNDY